MIEKNYNHLGPWIKCQKWFCHELNCRADVDNMELGLQDGLGTHSCSDFFNESY